VRENSAPGLLVTTTLARSKRADVPAHLASIVMKCLAKKASDRYQRGHDLADALIGYLGGVGSPEDMRAAWASRVLSPSRPAASAVG